MMVQLSVFDRGDCRPARDDDQNIGASER